MTVNLLHKPPVMHEGTIKHLPPESVKFENKLLVLHNDTQADLIDALRETDMYKYGEILEIAEDGSVLAPGAAKKAAPATTKVVEPGETNELPADAGHGAESGETASERQPQKAAGSSDNQRDDTRSSKPSSGMALPKKDSGDTVRSTGKSVRSSK